MAKGRAALAIGAISMAIAIGLGAFGAHALEGRISSDQMEWLKTAQQYQVWMSLALVALGFSGRAYRGVVVLFTLGIVVFSGSLYAMAFGAPRWFGAITPIGGASWIAAWLWLGVLALRSKG